VLIALDTSTAATVVAVATRGGELLAEARHDPSAGERPGHTTMLLPLAESALVQAGASWRDMRRIGVGVGPGGFTGLRAGLATGAALATALDADAVPISALDALARGTAEEGVVAVIDARRGEVFTRTYDAQGGPVCEPQVTAPEALLESEILAVGDGALLYRNVLEAAGMVVPADNDPRHRVQALALAQLAASGGPGGLEPMYLRAPDAKPRAVR
jgi:tRNA threonylcarbamoyladenosine biosynthesis protein TsaB